MPVIKKGKNIAILRHEGKPGIKLSAVKKRKRAESMKQYAARRLKELNTRG